MITGIAAWTSFGRGVDALSAALYEGRRGDREIPDFRFPLSRDRLRSRSACAIPDEDFAHLHECDPTVVTHLGRSVVQDALIDAELNESHLAVGRAGLVLGTTIGGGLAFLSHYRAAKSLADGDLDAILVACTPASIVGAISDKIGMRGPCCAISTACAASANAIGRAADFIRDGRADIMVAGGVDIFSEISISGFNALQATSPTQCRPFTRARDGLVLGDAGAMVVLEAAHSVERRGARPHAEFVSYAVANEAYHATGPDPTGTGAIEVMSQALVRGHKSPKQIDYINAHGTGTKANDAMEANAIRSVFGASNSDVPISSTKGLTGHTLGAAGALECVITIAAMKGGFLPTTDVAATEDDLQENAPRVIVGPSPSALVKVAMSNSFGFGGNVVSILLQSV